MFVEKNSEHIMKLTKRQVEILAIIRDQGPVDLDGVVARAGVRRATVVQVVRSLIRKDQILVDDNADSFRINPRYILGLPIEPLDDVTFEELLADDIEV